MRLPTVFRCNLIRQLERGFTLIELMVVLVMIGIIVSFAVLSIGDGNLERRVEQEGKKLISLIDLAGDSAMLHGEELGLYIGANDYQFVSFVDGQWLPYQEDRLLNRRTLPAQAHFELFLEGLPVDLSGEDETGDGFGDNEAPSLQPHLFILSSGERNPFELLINSGDRALYRIKGDLVGALSINPVGTVD